MTGHPVIDTVLLIAAVVTAVGAIWRGLHLGELLHGTREFLDDWQGEPARPGVLARPSIPQRLADVETQLCALVSQELRAEVIELKERVKRHREANAAQVVILQTAVNELNSAIADVRAHQSQGQHHIASPPSTEG